MLNCELVNSWFGSSAAVKGFVTPLCVASIPIVVRNTFHAPPPANTLTFSPTRRISKAGPPLFRNQFLKVEILRSLYPISRTLVT